MRGLLIALLVIVAGLIIGGTIYESYGPPKHCPVGYPCTKQYANCPGAYAACPIKK